MMSLQTMMQTQSSSNDKIISFPDETDFHHTIKQKPLQDEGSEHTEHTAELSDTESSSLGEEDDFQCYVAKKKQLHVGFEVTGDLLFIESHLTYSDEERYNYWYSSEEREQMLTENDTAVVRMEAGEPETANCTYRGLEKWTTKGAKKSENQVRRTIDAVLDEETKGQEWDEACDDELAIAATCQNLTACSVQNALRLGWDDELEAMFIQARK